MLEDRSGQKQALLNLEKLLKDLPNKYQVKYPDELDLEVGPDADFIDPSADLGNFPDKTTIPPVPATGLWAHATGTIWWWHWWHDY